MFILSLVCIPDNYRYKQTIVVSIELFFAWAPHGAQAQQAPIIKPMHINIEAIFDVSQTFTLKGRLS